MAVGGCASAMSRRDFRVLVGSDPLTAPFQMARQKNQIVSRGIKPICSLLTGLEAVCSAFGAQAIELDGARPNASHQDVQPELMNEWSCDVR
jgi:hypothetical protein